jgi:uncharacterized membrane protein YozB (DUF420 family)
VDLSFLPHINAGLNAVAAVLLLRGRALARAGRIKAHRLTMLSAFGVSTVFLASYLAHKVSRNFENTTLNVEGLAKGVYLMVLFSHVVLAMTVPFLAIWLIRLGLRDDRAKHRRVARIAWPIWMYVSITGVGIYLALYRFNPPLGGSGAG